MIVNSMLPVTRMLHECPKCGREAMTFSVNAEKEGEFYIIDPIVYRSCQCGFKIEYDTRQGTTRYKIKKAINQALEAMQ